MRHRSAKKILDRRTGPRRALLRSLAASLIREGAVTTTLAKARVLRPHVERLITTGRKKTLHARRQVAETLGDPTAEKILMTTLADRYAKRPGGYTRITKLTQRRGDGAQRARIELLTEKT